MRRVNKCSYRPDCKEMHLLIEMLYRGRKFFKAKLYVIGELKFHIPLPLQMVLMQSMGGLGVKRKRGKVYIFDIPCVPSYENRIVISHPGHAIYENEPMVIIELGTSDNYPTYKEIN